MPYPNGTVFCSARCQKKEGISRQAVLFTTAIADIMPDGKGAPLSPPSLSSSAPQHRPPNAPRAVPSLKIPPMNKQDQPALQELQALVDQWIQEHGVRYFDELTNMAQLTEEVGEVARIIARRYGEQSEKEKDKTKDLGEELADVLFVVLCLANQTGTDLHTAFAQKMNLKTQRDHERHQQNPKLHR